MRKKIVAGNWKMHTSLNEALDLYKEISLGVKPDEVDLLVFPPSIYLNSLNSLKLDTGIGAQNAHQEEKGAFTGEFSQEMLKSLKIKDLLIGHSERRQYFGETDELVNKKVLRGVENGFRCFVCVGESLSERQSGNYLKVILNQVEKALNGIENLNQIIIAYEPVWAIGTGETATPEQAQEVHQEIRKYLIKKFYKDTSILYGGSCKPENARELFSQKDIDGGLIGGASLKSDSFLKIANSFS
jgi:triosephosphate isomerase